MSHRFLANFLPSEIAPKYEVLKHLGSGAHADVALVRSVETQELHAVKRIRVVDNERSRLTIEREIQVMAGHKHRNIVALHSTYRDIPRRCVYLFLEYAPDGDLRDAVNANLSAGNLFAEYTVWEMLAQLLRGLDALHHPVPGASVLGGYVVHRDIRLANTFLAGHVLKLGDMGASRWLQEDERSSSIVGSLSNRAPEVFLGKPHHRPADVFAVGCWLWEMLTLNRPFGTQGIASVMGRPYSPPRIDPAFGYSVEITELCYKMLRFDPAHRPTTTQMLLMPPIMRACKAVDVETDRLTTLKWHERLRKEQKTLAERTKAVRKRERAMDRGEGQAPVAGASSLKREAADEVQEEEQGAGGVRGALSKMAKLMYGE